MIDRIAALQEEGARALAAASSLEALEEARLAWLGRSGRLQDVLRGIGSLPASERGPVGKAANEAKKALETAHAERLAALSSARESSLADAEWVDATMPASLAGPASRPAGGTIHPVAQMRRELEDACLSMGFAPLDGPWVEDELHNFEALNIGRDHPARDSQDTFWLEDGRLLRTHTSPVQIRAMERMREAGTSPPIRAVSLGRVFRNEALDASHENTFHQIEGLYVDRDVNVGHLVYVLRTLLSTVFRREAEVRLRPSFFPFTEPSFEMDLSCLVCGGKGCPVCKRTGWVELLGCGLVHRNVLRAGGIDPATWSGFAFGLGIDRLLMMRHGIEDIRHLNGGDVRFLREFARGVEG
jgi:phenylalanyl-tRNA synthetase alpha chain